MHPILDIQALSKSYEKTDEPAILNLSLKLKQYSITAVVGESGSGKTTLARLIAGFETPDSGSIRFNKTILASPAVYVPPHKRHIGVVFQDYALFPHLNVYKNIAYGISRSEKKTQRIFEMLHLVGLEDFDKRYPHQLSGGQQQRVAVARALAPKPSLLILDEPFSNLDSNLRIQLRDDIFKIINTTKTTAIFITHNIDDALAVADDIVVLKKGQLKKYSSIDTADNI